MAKNIVVPFSVMKFTQVYMYTTKTNAGEFRTEQVGELTEWGTVWYNEKSESNIFSFAEMAQRYHISYDNKYDDAFIVEMKNKSIIFQKISENIYAFDPTREKVSFMTTLQDNRIFLRKNNMREPNRLGIFCTTLGIVRSETLRRQLQ